eukprot:11379344-Karenia_brevis.AAC.1
MADFLANQVWNIVDINIPSRPPIFSVEENHVDCDPFTLLELEEFIHSLKSWRSAGPDGVPNEFWKFMSPL